MNGGDETLELDKKYNGSDLNGTTFLATQDGQDIDLDGRDFTVSSATTADGEEYGANDTISYSELNYSTSDMTEFQELNQRLQNLTAEINARQQNLR